MNKRIFTKLYKELFYGSKNEKITEKVFRCRMVLSLLTIFACTAVMATSTFALFHMNISSNNSTIESAYYTLQISNTENNTYTCPLKNEDKHIFEIKANGTATTGFCKIQVGEQVYYTEQIDQGTSLELTVQAAKDTVITFTPQWGTSSYYVNEDTCGNEIIHSTTPYAVYNVEPTARLAEIAAHYGVAEADILVYNDISAVAVADEESKNVIQLEAGIELKIPGVAGDVTPYAVPYATYIVEPTATLDEISAHYRISIEDISAFNDMSNFGTGMSLKIPNADSAMSDYSVPYVTYIVEPTAVIENISIYYGVSVDDIMTYNDISELVVGFELKIPGVSCDIAPYVAPVSEQTEKERFSKSESASSENSNTEVLDKDSTGIVEKTETTESSEEVAIEPTEESSEEVAIEPTEESSEEAATEPMEEASEESTTEPTKGSSEEAATEESSEEAATEPTEEIQATETTEESSTTEEEEESTLSLEESTSSETSESTTTE